MLEHLQDAKTFPDRTVVIGAGFIGGAIVKRLDAQGAAAVGLRRDFDLLAQDAGARLSAFLRPADSVVVVSAKAPVKNVPMLVENVRMAGAVCEALAAVRVRHIVYLSSDAVYADSDAPLTEASSTVPGSLHGHMHAVREAMLATVAGDVPYAVLRPTLVYGADDPHNGYGPNRFRRLAASGEPIVLFGQGEERRDHVCVDDIAELCERILARRSRGTLNAATGEVASFREIADICVRLSGRPVEIRSTPRQGPMPHNGYRPFDPAATYAAFPDFRYTPLETGLAASVLG
jgi:UDP-glucose 4-epimerase